MVCRAWFHLAAFAIIAGCAVRPLPALTPTHPASPAAAEAPASPPSATLTAAEGLPPIDSDTAPAAMATGHGAHQMPGSMTAETAGSYTCPMHPEVRATRPGRCPKCGMTLSPPTKGQSATGGSHAP